MTGISRRETLAGAGLVLLAGCGGGDSAGSATSVGSAPAPTPTPTPTPPAPPPPPPPATEVGAFGTLGLNTSQVFATLGNGQRGKGSGWDFIPEPGSVTTRPGHTMRFAAPASLLFSVPGLGEGQLVPRDNSGGFLNGIRTSADFNVLGGIVTLSRAIVVERLLNYVMLGYFVSAPSANQSQSNLLVEFGYGLRTPANALPSSGTAEYRTTSEAGLSIRANYSDRTVTGTVPFYVNGPTQASELRDVAISADGTGFSGRLIPPDGSAEGTIEGFFMGPAGEELLAQTTLRSGQSITLFVGVRVP